jgi:cell division inhibitor SepF
MGLLDGVFGNKSESEVIDDPNEIEESFYNDSNNGGKNKENEIDGTGGKMILLEPRAYSESQQIADHLKNRNSVVVNLKRVTSDQAKRIIDFLSGCIYAIGGTMKKVGVGIYLCAPKNVNVQGKITEENAKDKDTTKESEDIEW